jgi:hypothetical protein
VRITTTACEDEFGPYQLDGMDLMDTLITWMQHIPLIHQVHSLNTMLTGIPVHWWATHRAQRNEWEAMEESIRERFRLEVDIHQNMCPCKRHWVAKQ